MVHFQLDKVTNGSRISPAFANRQQALFSLTQYKVLPNACTKFQNPRSSSSWEIFDGKKRLHANKHTIIVMEKEKKISYIPTIYSKGRWV